MQLPTHLILGIFLQELLSGLIQDTILRVLLIIIICFISHFFVDAFSILTYHPPEREDTKVWQYWHIFIYVSGIIIFFLFFNPYWLGMLSAYIPDLWDWFFLRPLSKRKNKPELYDKYGIHFIADAIRRPLIRLGVPNLIYNEYGILPELIFISLVIIVRISTIILSL
ncbi:hypothetical protein [Candidatus Hodarchaeum mangrovi]